MSVAAPPSAQRIIPCLHYADARAALSFLCDAFGFESGLVMECKDGGIDHAELHMNGDLLMLASPHAAAGAEITQAPTLMPYGDRRCTARDCEGYRWSFHERVREVSEAEMQAVIEKAGE